MELYVLAHQGDAHSFFRLRILSTMCSHSLMSGSGVSRHSSRQTISEKWLFSSMMGASYSTGMVRVHNDAVGRTLQNRAILWKMLGVGDGLVGAQHDDVRLDAHALQLLDRVLGGLGLVLPGAFQIGHQRDVDKQGIFLPHLLGHLADGLQEGLALNVAGGAADFRDDHVGVGLLPHAVDKALDLRGDVGDDLDGLSQVLAPGAPCSARSSRPCRWSGGELVKSSSMNRS